jgi:very-short-patch-repair endonuclease
LKNKTTIFNKKALLIRRRNLRKSSTSAEIAFWNLIKSRKLEGRKFRRQHSIGNYIVDFYCPSETLIIELDGDSHGSTIQIEKDLIRENYLKSLGLKILRFENRYVFQDPEYVINEIKKKFCKD